MPVTPSALRRLIDQVIDTGEPLEIEPRGVIVRLVPPIGKGSWLERVPRRDGVVVGDPETLVQPTPSSWSPQLPGLARRGAHDRHIEMRQQPSTR